MVIIAAWSDNRKIGSLDLIQERKKASKSDPNKKPNLSPSSKNLSSPDKENPYPPNNDAMDRTSRKKTKSSSYKFKTIKTRHPLFCDWGITWTYKHYSEVPLQGRIKRLYHQETLVQAHMWLP